MPDPADLDWDDLRYFLRAARAGTLAGAARALGVEHSTIGRRLTALEKAFGTALLTRGPDGLALTAVGERLARLAEEMERTVLAARDLVSSGKACVRLAAPSGFSRIITPHLGRLQADEPDVTLELQSGSRRVDLKKGEADLALRVGVSSDDELITRKVAEVGWSLYASRAYLVRRSAPALPRDLAGHDLLGYDPVLTGMPGAKWLEAHGKGANVVMRGREVIDLVAACAAGIGLAVLPCMLAETEPTLTRLTPEVLCSHALSLVYRKEVLVGPPVKAVVRFVVDLMQREGDRLAGRVPAPA